MNTLGSFYKENKFSFSFIFLVWTISIYFLSTEEKGYSVLFFNENRKEYLNIFFLWTTQLGEGYFCVLACISVLIWQWKKGILLSLTLILNSLFAQFLKRMVFSSHHRPNYYFGDKLNAIENYEFHNDFSFPSGHTVAGVSLFFILSLFCTNKALKILIIFIGFLVAISRMYLAQHFLEDVFFGSILSVFLSTLYYIIYSKKVDLR